MNKNFWAPFIIFFVCAVSLFEYLTRGSAFLCIKQTAFCLFIVFLVASIMAFYCHLRNKQIPFEAVGTITAWLIVYLALAGIMFIPKIGIFVVSGFMLLLYGISKIPDEKHKKGEGSE